MLMTGSGADAADGHLIDLHGRDADTNGDALSILAAHADAFIQLQVVPDHGDIFESLRPVADERGPTHGPGKLAVFDEVAFRGGEHEVTACNVHLSAAKCRAI